MLDQQVSCTGCNLELYIEGWVAKSLIDDSLCYSQRYLDRKVSGSFFSDSQKFIEDRRSQPFISGLFSISFCELDKRDNLMEEVSVLESFQTHPISPHGQLEKNALYVVKIAIPLSCLNKFKFWYDSQINIRDNFLRSNAFLENLQYLDVQLENAKILKYLDPFGKNLLTKYTNEMRGCITRLKNVK